MAWWWWWWWWWWWSEMGDSVVTGGSVEVDDCGEVTMVML